MDIEPSSLIGWLIALTRWHVPTIRANCQSGLSKFFSLAGFIKERQIKRLGLFSLSTAKGRYNMIGLLRKIFILGAKGLAVSRAYLLALPVMDYAPYRIWRGNPFSDFIFVGLALVYAWELILPAKTISLDLLDYSGLIMIVLFSFSIFLPRIALKE